MFRSFVFMVMLGMACASSAEAVFECPADRMIPIQTTAWPAEFQPAVTMLANFKYYNHEKNHFNNLVIGVTEHVATQLARKKLCLTNTGFQRYACLLPEKNCLTDAERQEYGCQEFSCPDGHLEDYRGLGPMFVRNSMGDKASLLHMADKTQPLLQFVEWNLVAPTPSKRGIPASPHPVSPLDVAPPTSRGCRITSPWLDFAFEPRPVPWIRGVIRWNMRQMLMDQAMLTGGYNAPEGLLMPLETYSELQSLAANYKDDYMTEAIPPDLLWIFQYRGKRADYSVATHFPNTQDIAYRVMEKSAEHYTRLVTALIDQCFANEGADLHYKSILDVADLISLEEYKINMQKLYR